MKMYDFTSGSMVTTELEHMEMVEQVKQRIQHARRITTSAVERIAKKGQSKYKALIPAIDTTNGPEIVYLGIE